MDYVGSWACSLSIPWSNNVCKSFKSPKNAKRHQYIKVDSMWTKDKDTKTPSGAIKVHARQGINMHSYRHIGWYNRPPNALGM